jgi:folylpolyglutamate synthase/dihydropteroate synthase
MSKNHDPVPFLDVLAPHIGALIVTEPGFRPLPAGELAVAATRFAPPVIVPAARAIETAWRDATAEEVVVVTGSFYTVGETPAGLR